jgi:hypothetical protein
MNVSRPARAVLVVLALGACSDDPGSSADPTSPTVTAPELALLEGELSTGTETYWVRLRTVIRRGSRSR